MATNSTLGERVHEIIRQDIIAGRYNPGERLFFENIAKEIGVSMTPIKSAFMLLEKEGLVISVARKGTFVRELTRRDVVEYCRIRLALECLAVDHIGENTLAEEDEKKLQAICASMERHIANNDAAHCILDDINFHKQLVVASGNDQLLKMINSLPLTNLYNLVRKSPHYLQYGKGFLEEHRRMIRLLRKGDIQAIKAILAKHITAGDHSIFVAMGSDGEKAPAGPKRKDEPSKAYRVGRQD